MASVWGNFVYKKWVPKRGDSFLIPIFGIVFLHMPINDIKCSPDRLPEDEHHAIHLVETARDALLRDADPLYDRTHLGDEPREESHGMDSTVSIGTECTQNILKISTDHIKLLIVAPCTLDRALELELLEPWLILEDILPKTYGFVRKDGKIFDEYSELIDDMRHIDPFP